MGEAHKDHGRIQHVFEHSTPLCQMQLVKKLFSYSCRTGAIHIGDRLLAINGDTTRGKTLTEATNMLQCAVELVTLKIARPAETSSKYLKGNMVQGHRYRPLVFRGLRI